MSKPIFTIETILDRESSNFLLVSFEIPDGATTPSEFASAVAEIESQLVGKLPILVTGRGPIWGYGMILHAGHPSPAIAVYDPRLGNVVVQSHDSRFHVGDVLAIET